MKTVQHSETEHCIQLQSISVQCLKATPHIEKCRETRIYYSKDLCCLSSLKSPALSVILSQFEDEPLIQLHTLIHIHV